MTNLRASGRGPLEFGLTAEGGQYVTCPRQFVYTGHVSDQSRCKKGDTNLIILESDRVDREVSRCFRVPREPRRRGRNRMLLLEPLVSDPSALLTMT
jgi:hypothetical protein